MTRLARLRTSVPTGEIGDSGTTSSEVTHTQNGTGWLQGKTGGRCEGGEADW